MRRIAAGLALVALLGACTEPATAPVPAPASGAPARPVLVSSAAKVGTPPAAPAAASPTPVRPAIAPPAAPSNATAPVQRVDAAAARELGQAAPPARAKPAAPAAAKPAAPQAPAAKAKPGQTAKDAKAAEAAGAAEPSPTPKPTMRPAHIPRRGARPVFAPGRTSFVQDRGRDGVGFYRAGELTPAPHVYPQPRPPELDFFEDDELEEGTP